MAKILKSVLVCIGIFTCTFQSIAQEESTNQKLLLFETQLTLLKHQIGNSNIPELYAQLELLKQQRDPSNDEKISGLKAELETKEQQLKELQKNVTDLTRQITQLNSTLTVQNNVKKEAEALQLKAQETQGKVTQQTLGKYKSDVRNFAGFGALLDAVASTADGLLLFPENKSKEPFLQTLSNWIGTAGGAVGASLYSIGNSSGQQKAGILTTGLSLTITSLVNAVFKKEKNSQQLIENVARNRGFTDEVSSFSKSSVSFKVKAKELFENIKPYENNMDWKPNEAQLNSYYVLITLRRDLAVVLRQMQAKAVYLRNFETMTPGGKDKLNSLIIKYKEALDTWEGQEATFLSTYNYLKNQK
jgi:hypothetical protein